MLFNLLSYSDDEIEAVLAAARIACGRLDVDPETEEGNHLLRRAIGLVAGGVVDEEDIAARLCAGRAQAHQENSPFLPS